MTDPSDPEFFESDGIEGARLALDILFNGEYTVLESTERLPFGKKMPTQEELMDSLFLYNSDIWQDKIESAHSRHALLQILKAISISPFFSDNIALVEEQLGKLEERINDEHILPQRLLHTLKSLDAIYKSASPYTKSMGDRTVYYKIQLGISRIAERILVTFDFPDQYLVQTGEYDSLTLLLKRSNEDRSFSIYMLNICNKVLKPEMYSPVYSPAELSLLHSFNWLIVDENRKLTITAEGRSVIEEYRRSRYSEGH